MITLIGHHTCRNDRGKEDVENAPYWAQNEHNEPTQYLGDGYYLWNDCLEDAHWWGSVLTEKLKSCKKYVIVKFSLDFDENDYFDAYGDRGALVFLSKLIEFYKTQLNDGKELTLAAIFDLIDKKITDYNSGRLNKNPFPYKVIRVRDENRAGARSQIKFAGFSQFSMLELNPKLIICIKSPDINRINNPSIQPKKDSVNLTRVDTIKQRKLK